MVACFQKICEGKINATAGGKQGLESVMIKVLLKYYLESTK